MSRDKTQIPHEALARAEKYKRLAESQAWAEPADTQREAILLALADIADALRQLNGAQKPQDADDIGQQEPGAG